MIWLDDTLQRPLNAKMYKMAIRQTLKFFCYFRYIVVDNVRNIKKLLQRVTYKVANCRNHKPVIVSPSHAAGLLLTTLLFGGVSHGSFELLEEALHASCLP